MVIELVTTAEEMREACDVFDAVWGSATPVITVELLVAIAHGGGYVSVAREPGAGTDGGRDGGPDHGRDGGRPVGASVGFLARHQGRPALHSHVTGLIPSVRGTGLGRAIKLHQRAWAIANGLHEIVWTFDPLVRRNAWFNIAVLGADVHEYLPSFYGSMTDAINTGDESDRLLVAWDVRRPVLDAPRDGRDAIAGAFGPIELVPTPEDIVELRRTDAAAVARWRSTTRTALTDAIAAHRPIVGFTRAGDYVIGST